jgi:hypothetical protein
MQNNILPDEVEIIHAFRGNKQGWSVHVLSENRDRKKEIRLIVKKNWKNIFS